MHWGRLKSVRRLPTMNIEPPPSNSVPPSSLTPAPPPSRPAFGAVISIVSVAGGIGLCFAKALLWAGGHFTAEASGYATASALIPGLIAYFIAGRKRVRNPVRFGLWFLAISAFFLVLEIGEVRLRSQNQVADIIKAAKSSKPTDSSGTSSEQSVNMLAADVGRDLFDRVRTYDQKTAPLEPELKLVYTAESFASATNMRHALNAVREMAALDHDLLQQIESWPDRVQQRVAQSSLPPSEKQDFLAGFRRSFADSRQLNLRRHADEVETQWVQETVALYDLTLAHSTEIKVKDQQVIISRASTLDQFNRQLKKAQDLHQSLIQINEQLQRMQREALQQFGLTPKDIDLSSSDSSAKQ
jgi:hypothetical protein